MTRRLDFAEEMHAVKKARKKERIGVDGLEEHHGCQKAAERRLYPPSKAISPPARVKPTARSSPPYERPYTASRSAYHPSSTKIPAVEVEGFRRRGASRLRTTAAQRAIAGGEELAEGWIGGRGGSGRRKCL
ncbi:hypothetical protein MRX96_027699 [Rhipicephalus microplus]